MQDSYAVSVFRDPYVLALTSVVVSTAKRLGTRGAGR
jgi:hypothetical protein